jgi:hypothetical protein
MLSPDRKQVKFVQTDPCGHGEHITRMEKDVFLVLVEQARSFEQLRLLWFGWCERKTPPKQLEAVKRYQAKGKAAAV